MRQGVRSILLSQHFTSELSYSDFRSLLFPKSVKYTPGFFHTRNLFLEIIILCKQLQKRDLTINLFVCTFFIWRTCKLFANSGFMRNLPISSTQPKSSQELDSGVCYRIGFQYLLKISCGVWNLSISLSV